MRGVATSDQEQQAAGPPPARAPPYQTCTPPLGGSLPGPTAPLWEEVRGWGTETPFPTTPPQRDRHQALLLQCGSLALSSPRVTPWENPSSLASRAPGTDQGSWPDPRWAESDPGAGNSLPVTGPRNIRQTDRKGPWPNLGCHRRQAQRPRSHIQGQPAGGPWFGDPGETQPSVWPVCL